jgi:cellulose synthase/poly-beta-1,6-N-acetylglucosamine synthase-like glycosyltransferase
MVSIIVTSYNEPQTIGKCITSLIDRAYSGLEDDFELITVIPDAETRQAAEETVRHHDVENWKCLADPLKGKPLALNLGLNAAKGDFIILTDGDVCFSENSVAELLKSLTSSDAVGGVSGRQYSQDDRNTLFGYYSHLFAEAIHLARSKLLRDPESFYPMSGYVMAVKKKACNFRLPSDVLVDDAYMSYMIYNEGYRIAYAPKAAALVKYPKTLSDYLKQKVRSTGGYLQLQSYGIVAKETKARTFKQDLRLLFFPFRFAETYKELIWSLALYPIRTYLWLIIWVRSYLFPKSMQVSWKRVETTK